MLAAHWDWLSGRSRVRATAISTLLILAGAASSPTGSVAEARPGPNQAARLAGAIADTISSAATGRQNPDGTMSDYVKETLVAPPVDRPRNRYGPAVMGAGLVLNGARTSRSEVVRAGLRSILSGIRSGEGFYSRAPDGRTYLNSQYPFSMLGVVSAWPAISRKGSSGFGITPADRRSMRRVIRQTAPLPAASDPTRLVNGSNRVLLEHLVWLEALGFGLRPLPDGSSPIVRRPRATSLRAARWIDGWISSRPIGKGGADGPVSFVSDAPAWPNAYLALSSALVARAIRVTDPPLENRLRSLLRRAVRAARLLVSPGGDIAWAGRSNLQSWTLSMTAYAALASASDPGISAAEAARNRSFAFRLLDRLRSAYLRPDGRVWLVPGLAIEPFDGLDALDWYAAEVPYTGLTLMGLEWAAREDDAGPFRSESPTSTVLWPGSDGATFGVLRTPGLWAGLRGSSRSLQDARLDSGPVAAKQLSGGSWRWLLHPPPAIPAVRPPSWIATSVGPEELAPVRVVDLERRRSPQGDSMVASVEFPEGGEPEDLEFSEAECGGLALSGGSLPKPIIVSFWLPNPSREGPDGGPGVSEGSMVSFDGGEAFSPTASSVDIGSPGAGSSHPSLSPTSFGFEAGAPGPALDICLD